MLETQKGMSLSMAIIPSCSELIEASRRERVQDEATNFISGWMNSVIFLGEFLGPVIGGCLIDKYQNIVTATSIFGFGALVAVSNWQTS